MSPIITQLQRMQPVSAAAAAAFENIIKKKWVRKGQPLLRIGQKPDHFFFIDKGLARVFYQRNGKDITDYFAIDQQFIGAVPALFTGQPSHKAIEVLEDAHVYYFSYAAFDQLCSLHHDLERAARKQAIYGMLEGQQRIESIRFLSAKNVISNLKNCTPALPTGRH